MIRSDVKIRKVDGVIMLSVFNSARMLSALTVSILAFFICSHVSAQSGTVSSAWRPLTTQPDCLFYDFIYGEAYPVSAHWDGACSTGKIDGPGNLSAMHYSPQSPDHLHAKTIMKGHFKNGLLQGDGEFSWVRFASGVEKQITYLGPFHNSMPNGKGKLYISPEIQFEGLFNRWSFNGPGVLKIADHLVIRGEFNGRILNATFSGRGEFEYADSARYKGEFKDALEHGQGEKYFVDGTRHKGEFQDGWPMGHGIVTFPDGSTCEGKWRKKKLIGIGKGFQNGKNLMCIWQEETGLTFIQIEASN